MGKLTALDAKNLKEPGRHGDGLYLHTGPSDGKSWVQRIVIQGRRRDIGLGLYPAISPPSMPHFTRRTLFASATVFVGKVVSAAPSVWA